jgi:hypothetical protein
MLTDKCTRLMLVHTAEQFFASMYGFVWIHVLLLSTGQRHILKQHTYLIPICKQ